MKIQNMKMSLIVLIVGFFILIIGGVGGYFIGRSSVILPTDTPPKLINPIPPTPQETACTLEARICPDGSPVGRVPPNCKFAPCPDQTISPIIDNQNNVDNKLSVPCGGWDTSGEIRCECSGKLIKPPCPIGASCDGASYICEGQCANCCYDGIAENNPYPPCLD